MTSYPGKPKTPEEEQAYLVETLTKTIDRALNGDVHLNNVGDTAFILMVLCPVGDDQERCYLTMNLRRRDAIESMETAIEALEHAIERMRPN